MPRLVRTFSFLILAFVCSYGCTRSTSQDPNTALKTGPAKTLNLYCWSNYFSPEVIKKFEDKTGSKVVLNYFSSNEELLAKLQAGARGYDVIVPTSYMVTALKELKLIQPLGKIDWKEIESLASRFKSPSFDPKHEYTVPYAWGTTGIAVNKSKVKENVDSLKWLFDHPEFKGQITMLDDAPTVIGTALKYLGYSYNEQSPEALLKAKELLIRQKKLLKSYTPESQPVLESGETAISQAYSGDALQVKARKNSNIEFILPKEGGEIFVDSLAIPVGAPSPDLAKEFIRFTLQSEVALTQVLHLFFSPVVDLSHLPSASSTLKNSVIFPPEGKLKNFEMMQENPTRMEALQKIWTELKSH